MKRREEKILSYGMGPRITIPKEKEDKAFETATRFVDDNGNPAKELKIVDKAVNMKPENHQKNEIKRGEEGYRTREFSYDVNEDPLFKQYLASARRNGEKAMTDTVAKSAAMTGGVAGSYAVSAGANAYNDYMQSANDVIPQLEQIAYQKYKDELNRDLKIMEMDEADRWENANVSSIVQDYQNYGAPLTAEQRTAWVARGGYIDGDVLIDAFGNRYERGTKYNKEREQEAYNKYESYGWDNLTAEEQRVLQEAGYAFDRNENMIGKDGMSFAWNNVEGKAKTTKVNTILNKFQNGRVLTDDELYILNSNGYNYSEATKTITDTKTGNTFKIDEGITNQRFRNAYNAYFNKGWSGLTNEERQALEAEGYFYNAETDMIGEKDSEGKFISGYYWSETVFPEDIALKYRNGGKLDEKDIKIITRKGTGYTYKNGILYKDGTEVEKDFEIKDADAEAVTYVLINKFLENGESELSDSEKTFLKKQGYSFKGGKLVNDKSGDTYTSEYSEGQEAYDKYKEYGWHRLSREEQNDLRKMGFEYDESKGMIGNGIEYYSWGNGTPIENVIEDYTEGKDISYAEKLLKENGYIYLDGTLYDSQGKSVVKDYELIWNEAMKVFQSEGYDALNDLQKAVIDYYGYYDAEKNWVYRGNKAYASDHK